MMRRTVLAAVTGWVMAFAAVVGASERGDLTTVRLYQVTGVVDNANAATAVHCTNVGDSSGSVTAVWRLRTGSVPCTTGVNDLPPQLTVTFATADVAALRETLTCPAGLTIQQGSVLILVDSTQETDFICSVEIIDPASATPDFGARLDLYDRYGLPVKERALFVDGFESGTTLAWTSSLP